MIERLIKEICQKGNVTEYEIVLMEIVNLISQKGCTISCSYINEASSIEQSLDSSIKAHIRLGFKKPKVEPIQIIWDLFHEFGHFLSGVPAGNYQSLEREIDAWELAELELANFPDLMKHIDSFCNYRDICLETYK